MAILGLTQITTLEFFKDKGKTINSFVCIAILIFLVGYPIFTTWFLRKSKENLAEPQFETKFNSLYQSLRTDDGKSLLSTTFFLLRRLILAIAIIFIGNG
jgi:hypothetical protein